jgi:site-specific recombinase XerD
MEIARAIIIGRVENLAGRRMAAKTLSFYACQLLPFVRHCQEQSIDSIYAVTPVFVREYFIDLEARGLSDYSVHAAARAMRAFFNFCVREEHLDVSPMVKVAMPRVSKRILPSFSADEVHRLLASCESRRDRHRLSRSTCNIQRSR